MKTAATLMLALCLTVAGEDGPHATVTGNSLLDELDVIDLEALLGNSDYCIGVGYDGTYLWVTDALGLSGGKNSIHIVSLDGSLVQTVYQNSTTGWGLRDLCFDGTRIYGSESSRVDYYDAATFEKEGAYYCYACNPNRAQAYDGAFFYTGSFSTAVYRVTWDGVSGSTATYSAWSTAVAGAGTNGAAWDAYNDCLWVTSASGELYQIASDGSLVQVFTCPAPGGCSVGNVSGYGIPPWPLYKALWILDTGTTARLRACELMPETPLERVSWGELKTLF